MTEEQKQYFDNVLWEYVLEEFDFQKVKRIMDYLEWQWQFKTPTVSDIINNAYRLCFQAYSESIKDSQFCLVGTGGFEASYTPEIKSLELKFIVESIDTEFCEDEDDLI